MSGELRERCGAAGHREPRDCRGIDCPVHCVSRTTVVETIVNLLHVIVAGNL